MGAGGERNHAFELDLRRPGINIDSCETVLYNSDKKRKCHRCSKNVLCFQWYLAWGKIGNMIPNNRYRLILEEMKYLGILLCSYKNKDRRT